MIKLKRLFVVSFLFLGIFLSQVFAQKINQFDASGKRTGVWRKYYENGKKRYEGQFKNGKEVGVFTFYNEASSYPTIVKQYSSTSDTAVVKFYNKSRVKTQGKMVGKQRVGKWIYYFSDGKRIFSEETYKNGKLNGLLKNYYNNGRVTEETMYRDGKKEGLSKIFSDQGTLIEAVNYSQGKLNGLAKYFDLKGVIKEKGNYKNGVRDGKWEFYIDGEISSKGRKRRNLLKNDELQDEEEDNENEK